MCGIAGYFGSTACELLSSKQLLAQMISTIRHRGPDDQGIFVDNNIGLAHARLSIIDLSTGQQPMSSSDGSLCTSFNGEIFNYIELTRELEAKGHRYRTSSDTETILHAYREWGSDCVQHFNGDFAFALWDRDKHQLMLARDRMGVRPLYWTVLGETIYFASEIKALFEVPGIEAEIDPIALDQTFTFWFPLAPRTIFKNIHELQPGHVLIARHGSIFIEPYWKLNFANVDEERADRRSSGEIAEQLAELLKDSTRIRLRADVPVGAYLSGGLDSSIIAALVREVCGQRLCTFSVAFDEAEFDESSWQAEMVRALGTDHRSTLCTASDIGENFFEMIRHIERPILRTAPGPMMRLSKLVRDCGFKVVLTGEGADEILGGYDIFKEAKIRRFIAKRPESMKRAELLKQLYPYLPALQGQSAAYLSAFFRASQKDLDDPLFSHLPRWNMTARTKAFFSQDLKRELEGYDALDDLRQRLPKEFMSFSPLSRAQYLEAAHLLPNYLLSSQGDRVAMASAVEGRFPYLDHRLVEFATRIPSRLRMKGMQEKYILRKSMEKYLPPQIARRTKQPYRAPDARSIIGEDAPEILREQFRTEHLQNIGIFDANSVSRLICKCRESANVGYRESMSLVGILSTQLLVNQFVQSTSALGGSHAA